MMLNESRHQLQQGGLLSQRRHARALEPLWSVLIALQPAVLEERNGEIEFRVVINNDGSRDSTIILTGLKCLFQKQQPKMPKDYIARLVYDRTHLSIAIVKMPLEVIEGITFREFRDRYGAHLMAHLKDYVRATSPVMHF